MNSIWKYAVIGLGILLLVVSFFAWKLYGDYQEERRSRERLAQNLEATRDSAAAAFAELSETAIFVRDLRDSIDGQRKVFHALQTRYTIAIESLRVTGTAGAVIVTGDSTIRVPFAGRQRFVRYDGWTLYDTRSKRGTYGLSLDFDEPEFTTDLFRDESTGIWNVRVESLTDGFRYRSTTAVDEKTYELLQKYPPPERSRWFGIGAIGNGESAYAAVSIHVAGKYELIGGYALSKPEGASTFLVGGLWKP